MTVKLERVEQASSATLRFLSGWFGVNIAPKTYYFSDGYVLKPYPRGTFVPDWSWILRGAKDVSGARYVPYLDAAGIKGKRGRKRGIILNALEFGGPFTAPAGAPVLDRIRAYTGGLTSSATTWPKQYREAYFDTH